MSFGERKAIRFKPAKDRFAILKLNDDYLARCQIEDISYTGVCLELKTDLTYKQLKDKSLDLLFNINSQTAVQYSTEIVRENPETKWLALKFRKNITKEHLTQIRGVDDSSYDLAKIDKTSVLKEALQIKTCSSNYFIWTIGLMIPLISAIWTLYMQDQIEANSCTGAMLGMFLLFCMSIFSSLEKSRAIYKREGFVAALDTYLVHGVAPPDYKGWINLKYSYAECASKREAEICPREISEDSRKSCKFIGEKNAEINRFKKIIPSILDSFISLTSMFYSILYVVIIILSATAITKMFSGPIYLIENKMIISLFIAGFVFGFLVFGRNTNMLVFVVFGTIAMFAIDALKPGIPFSLLSYTIDNVFVKILILFIAYIFGSIGNIFVSQLIRLRTKEYSLESHFYMWLHLFENCVLMPDYKVTIEERRNKLKAFGDFLIDFVFFRKLYSRKRT